MAAMLVVAGLIGITLYFGIQWIQNGLVDIDDVSKRSAQYQVNVNEAQWFEFINLPGIGETLAKAIVEHREVNGPFQSHEEITNVSGIAEGKLRQIKPFLLPIPNSD